MGRIILVSGGTRSGKSRFAESLCLESPSPHYYVATCPRIPNDADLQARIALHQAARANQGFTTIEEELELGYAFEKIQREGASALLECLGLWINNLLYAKRITDLQQESALKDWVHAQCKLWRESPGTLVVVAQEAGLGVQPVDRESRLWLDLLGTARNAFAAEADEVWMMVSGIPLQIKKR